ncbi:MAG: hypothetical protein RLN89_06575 [Parvibaculum sp.]
MAFPAAFSRIFLVVLVVMMVMGFAVQWEQSQRLKFLGISVDRDKVAFEIANYGQSFVGKTDYVGSIMLVTEDEKSVSLFNGAIDIIPPSRSVVASIRFNKTILPAAVSDAESTVTQFCLYTRGKLFFDTHMFKVYFRHATARPNFGGASALPDLELTEYKHVFFGRPACSFTGAGNYFTYEINTTSIDCEPVGDGVEMLCRTEGVKEATLEGVFDPIQTIVQFRANEPRGGAVRETEPDRPSLRN